jgi:hypothetical protein
MKFLLFITLIFSFQVSANFQSCFDTMMSLVQPRAINQGSYQLNQATTLSDLEAQVGHESLFSLQQRLSSEQIQTHNHQVGRLLVQEPELNSSVEGLASISQEQARTLYQDMINANVYHL